MEITRVDYINSESNSLFVVLLVFQAVNINGRIHSGKKWTKKKKKKAGKRKRNMFQTFHTRNAHLLMSLSVFYSALYLRKVRFSIDQIHPARSVCKCIQGRCHISIVIATVSLNLLVNGW